MDYHQYWPPVLKGWWKNQRLTGTPLFCRDPSFVAPITTRDPSRLPLFYNRYSSGSTDTYAVSLCQVLPNTQCKANTAVCLLTDQNSKYVSLGIGFTRFVFYVLHLLLLNSLTFTHFTYFNLIHLLLLKSLSLTYDCFSKVYLNGIHLS